MNSTASACASVVGTHTIEDEPMTVAPENPRTPTVGRSAVYVRPGAEFTIRYITNAEMLSLAPGDRPTANLSRSDNGDGYFQVVGVKAD